MTAIPRAQVTHESETQRQHVRFALPSRAVVDGREYEVKDISCGGIALRGIKGDFKPGMNLPLSLRFMFDSFTFGIRLDAEVRHYSAEKSLLGCRFVNLGPQQVAFLTYVIKSFIGGEVVTAGGLLNVAARNNNVKPRAAANQKTAPALRRQLPGLAVVAALGLLILTVIGQNVYNGIFVIRTDEAAVAGPVVPVRAAANGTFRSVLDPDLAFVKQNQTIGTITPATGAPVTVQSPCNCYITRTHVASGEIAGAGDKLLSLIPVDATPWIVAELDPAQGKRISPSAKANITVFGSRNLYTGHVASMDSPLSDAANATRAARIRVVLDQKLPVDFIDRLATVTFTIH